MQRHPKLFVTCQAISSQNDGVDHLKAIKAKGGKAERCRRVKLFTILWILCLTIIKKEIHRPELQFPVLPLASYGVLLQLIKLQLLWTFDSSSINGNKTYISELLCKSNIFQALRIKYGIQENALNDTCHFKELCQNYQFDREFLQS